MQDNEELYQAWETQAESKFETGSDLGNFNSIIFYTSGKEKADTDYFTIGYDKDNDLFYCIETKDEEDTEVYASQDAADLDKWLEEINAK